MLRPVVIALLLARSALSAVTVYTAAATSTGPAPTYSNPSIDQSVLQPPSPPTNQNQAIAVQVPDGGIPGMSNPVAGSFLGWSIELSIANVLIGENATVLRPEFLNYCAVLAARGGGVTIRVGGNTQDKAVLFPDGLPGGKTIVKTKDVNSTTPTNTPIIDFSMDLFKAMQSVGNLIKVGWFFGIPFIATDEDGNAGLIVSSAKQYLGDSLLGLQLANEPDLYNVHGKKPTSYTEQDFFDETTLMIQRLPITEPLIIGPSICCMWDINKVLIDDGYLSQFSSSIKLVDAMHYPNNNCVQGAGAVVPQDIYSYYLSHTNVQNIVSPYQQAVAATIAAGKQFMMMETNTASCGGFPGVSDSFGAALWGTDYGMQMAFGNFSYALFHFGGQNVYYNPFTPPPTNMTKYYKWSTGPIFYSNLIVAEALGKSGNARVTDLYLDGNNANRAGYAVYEGGAASRVLLINYVTEPGTGDYVANIAIGGLDTGLPSLTPASVRVKYLLSASNSVAEKFNITWSGQTMGGMNAADGRLTGTPNVQTIQCANGQCAIPVPAPSIALVFLTDAAYANSGGEDGQQSDGSILTFATTTTTGKHKATIDPAALATSNGHSGSFPLMATSKGQPAGVNDAARRSTLSWWSVGVVTIAGLVMGRWMV
ncbi:hypothetical protein FRB93_006940 [Tulasnella sp. JGI-2019a]|nr:hypothetical protein FRB93_006940 [Tulasnella sp. JGI-2019a]